MLATSAHVKIGTIEYVLDESVDPHYQHRFMPIYVNKTDISGDPGKQQIDPDRLLWAMTDWSGGEGNNVYQPDQPNVYRISNGMNVRKVGQATVRPKRARATLATTDESKQPYFAVGDGALWVVGSTQAHFSTDYGDTWTTLTEANSGVTDFDAAGYVTCATGDERYAYYAAFEASGTKRRTIIGHDAVSGAETIVVSAHDSDFPYAELAMFNGRLYAWTGRKLFEIDVFETLPISSTGDKYRKVYDTGIDPATSHVQGNQWTAGMVNCGTSLCFFYARQLGGGNIYEYKDGVARPIWQAPLGFTIGSIYYQSGVVLVAGHWGLGLVTSGTDTAAQGSGALYAIPLDTLREIDLGYIREFDGDTAGGLLMTKGAGSYGAQTLIAGGGTGRLFVYDMKHDGITMLDHLKDAPAGGDSLDFDGNPNERVGDMITAGPNRLAAIFRPNSSAAGADIYQILTWEDDTPTNRETDGQMATDSTTVNYLESAEWDYDFPLSMKVLHGLHVTFMVEDTATTSGLLANQRIVVKYSIDGAAYVTAGTITSASTPVGVIGRVFISVAGTKFYRLRVRFEVDNNTTDGVKPPIVYAILAEASLGEWQEEWDLIVRVKDEPQGNARSRARRYEGGKIRDYLEDLFQARSTVTFLDGYRYKKVRKGGTNGYTTHTCKLIAFEDTINKLGEGACRVVLRAVPATS